jgi:hypothetical protein
MKRDARVGYVRTYLQVVELLRDIARGLITAEEALDILGERCP